METNFCSIDDSMESSESSLDLSLSYSSSEFVSFSNFMEDVQDTSDGVDSYDPYQHEPMASHSRGIVHD